MRFLIVEDREEKAEEIISEIGNGENEFIRAVCEKDTKDILSIDQKFDLILLDMAFPKSKMGTASDNKYGGINILNFMKINNIEIPVIVISIYWDFSLLNKAEPKLADRVYYNKNENVYTCYKTSYIMKMNNLEELHIFMSNRFHNYVGAVQYSDINNAWKKYKKIMGG